MSAKVTIDTMTSGPQIDPKLFGHFLENMAGGIYRGGLLARDGSVREQVARALDEMGVSVLRWPGGLFADGYDWTDGIGPDRPVRPNRYWRKLGPRFGPKDPNHFGTHEFLALCQRLGAAPYVNVNLGRGTAESAARWVQYCNGAPDTPEGRRRTDNGRSDPWKVKIWGIGNESFGWWAYGHSSPKVYAERFERFYEAMIEQDDTIAPVAVGTCDLWPDWNRAVLSKIGERAAYLSVHVYLPGNQPPYLFLRPADNAATHYALCSAYLELERKLRFVAQQIESTLGPTSAVRIALDEWNLWWWFTQARGAWWTLRDAVAVAGMAGAMVDCGERVGMGNIAQAINVLGLLRTDYDHVVKTPPYFAMKLLASTLQGRRLTCRVEGKTYRSKKLGGIPAADSVPYVSAYATAQGDRFGLVLIQRRYERPMRIEIEAPGINLERVSMLAGPSPLAKNTFADPHCVGVTDFAPAEGRGGLSLEMPPASVAAIEGVRID